MEVVIVIKLIGFFRFNVIAMEVAIMPVLFQVDLNGQIMIKNCDEIFWSAGCANK